MRSFELWNRKHNLLVNKGRVYENDEVEIYYTVPIKNPRPARSDDTVYAMLEGPSKLMFVEYVRSLPRHFDWIWVS